MARVPYVHREDMDMGGKSVYDKIRYDRNSSEVGLQFRALLHRPKATGYLTSLGAELRFNNALPGRVKELTIIMVAREWNSHIEWTGHARLALNEGVTAESIEAIRSYNTSDLPEDEKLICDFVVQMLHDKNVDEGLFRSLEAKYGVEGVVDLTLTVCYYTAVSLAQISLQPGMEKGAESTL